METKDLVENYIDGWKNRDVRKIVSHLSDNCVVIESHGVTYRGLSEIREWTESWFDSGNEVVEWNLISLYEFKDVLFFEWDFRCLIEGREHFFEGISVVKIKNEKISYIREYRTTKPRFDWKNKRR